MSEILQGAANSEQERSTRRSPGYIKVLSDIHQRNIPIIIHSFTYSARDSCGYKMAFKMSVG